MPLIVTEGLDGSGKSTHAKLLYKWLSGRGLDCLFTKEPGSPYSEECKKIRAMVLDPAHDLSTRAELFLFLADRAQHVDKIIKPALEAGKIVISDRYMDSTYVYQQIGRGFHGVGAMNDFAIDGVRPDLVFVFDVPANIGLARAKGGNKEFAGGDRMEQETLEYFEKVRNGFLDIAKTRSSYFVIDGLASIEDNHETVKQLYIMEM